MREFDYADREMYENLSRPQMVDGDNLPPDMNDEGQSCANDTL